MIIVIDAQAEADERAALIALVNRIAGQQRPVVAVSMEGREVMALDHAILDAQTLETLRRQPAVAQILTLNTPYQLVSRGFKAARSSVLVGDGSYCQPVVIGGERAAPVIMAGPCAVESREQLLATARAVKEAGAHVLRGGAFKPRTSPYQFQGLGIEGLRLLAEARQETGLPIVTEVMEPEMVSVVAEYADMLQIGARNMQNFPLLQAVGRKARGKPVLLKRGLSATIEEWLLAAEYIVSAGNPQVILCERGVRSFDVQTRNLLDLACVPLLRELTHLPVIVDPSHATGRRELVPAMARAGVAAGADGLILEVHPDPGSALCDGRQSITPEQLRTIVHEARLLMQMMQGETALSPVA
jgi:3-deoxy-7-phosphoheptulonate synthase